MRHAQAVAPLLFVVVVSAGCATPWVGVHRGLTAAHAVNHTAYQALEGIREDILLTTRARVVEQYELARVANPTTAGTPEEALVRWQADIDAYRIAVDATYTVDGALVDASTAVVEWSEAQGEAPPAAFHAACATLGLAMPQVLAGLERFEVDYPEELDLVAAVLGPVCRWSVDVIASLAARGDDNAD